MALIKTAFRILQLKTLNAIEFFWCAFIFMWIEMLKFSILPQA